MESGRDQEALFIRKIRRVELCDAGRLGFGQEPSAQMQGQTRFNLVGVS